jgi:hypothetical protein
MGTSDQPLIELTTTEIADAAIREIVQISLSSSPFDLLLEQLLDNSQTNFSWVSQLGQIRETRTALSGLFGRFIARAYLTRYFGFAYFEPIRQDRQILSPAPSLMIRRATNESGDLPDWVTTTPSVPTIVAIAEAKGSHNVSGGRASLAAAIAQARRVDIWSENTKLMVKRYAIATRWAVSGNPQLQEPWLLVNDPEDGERHPNDNELLRLRRGIALGHFAGLAGGFGAKRTRDFLLRAKEDSGGEFGVAAEDIVEIESARGYEMVLAALVTRSGIIPLPQHMSASFKINVREVFGEEVLLLTINLDDLFAINRMEHRKVDTSDLSEPENFWAVERVYADGSRLIPLNGIDIRPRSA